MAPRTIINDTVEYNRRINSIRRLLKTKTHRINSIRRLLKTRTHTKANWPMKPIRATPIKIMEKDNVNDGGKSKVLSKTLEEHDQLKNSKVPMEEGVNLLPNASQGDFLPEKEQPPSSNPIELPTKPTLHSNLSPENPEHGILSKKKSSNFFYKIDFCFLSSRLDSIMKRKSTPKIEVAELLAFIGVVQDINAVRPLPSEFLNKILSDLAEASDISEHTYFTNDSFTKIIAQIINKTL